MRTGRAWTDSRAKRSLDVSLTLAGLVALAPLMLLVAAAVRLALGRPVIFCQERPGRDGRPFRLYKFRTMSDARDRQGKPLTDEARLGRFGRFLRSTSLDELPELWNVLRGEMSLVGPRPLLIEYLPLYTAEQRRRHEAPPGLTGWQQVHGRNRASWEQRFVQDVWYVDHASFWLDLRILLRTVIKVVARSDISGEGSATVVRYTGPAKQDKAA